MRASLFEHLVAFRKRIRIGSVRSRFRTIFVPVWRPFLHRVRFIAVTGSCGKTTTVLLLGRMLATTGKTTSGALVNTQRGIHKTILATKPSDRWCVQELSGHQPGHIRKFAAKLKPTVGIVTMVGTDHLSNFRTQEGIAQEKGTLVEVLPNHGLALLNADDPRVLAMSERTRARVVTYGLSEGANVRASDVRGAWPEPLSFTLLWRERSVPIETQLIGQHWVTPLLAAAACALEEGVALDKVVATIRDFSPVHSRNSVHAIDDGPTFLLDTVKAPYGTIDAAIALLDSADAPRKTLVIGNISDYPGAGSSKYRQVARNALKTGARVIGVGRNANAIRKLKSEFPDRVFTFASSREARDFIASTCIPGELVLLKSAASGHIERIFLNWANGDERCWAEECGLKYCKTCKVLTTPYPTYKLGSEAAASTA